jgi:hypothetical protein
MNLERHIINSIKQQNNISDKDVEIYEFGLHLLILKLFLVFYLLVMSEENFLKLFFFFYYIVRLENMQVGTILKHILDA